MRWVGMWSQSERNPAVGGAPTYLNLLIILRIQLGLEGAGSRA